METILNVEQGNTLAALQGFLKKLLESNLVEVLLVPMRTPSQTISPALVSDPALLDYADPLAPVFTGNSATLVGKLSQREPRAKMAAILRPCEARALVELTKMQQASLDDLILIALDCAGTYSVPVLVHKQAEHGNEELWRGLYQNITTNPEITVPELRFACQICEQPVYDNAHVVIEMLSSDPTTGIRLFVNDELGEQLGFSSIPANNREATIQKLISTRTMQRDSEFQGILSRLEGEEGMAEIFAACIRCHNCMTVCPICYCKTCVFKSAIFDHDPMQFVEWSRQKGAYRLPADTMLFHLTRLNHMALSCVGCGMCSDACPVDLPVGLVFRAIGQRLQQTFNYLPGQSPDEPLPLITFKADEWTEVGE